MLTMFSEVYMVKGFRLKAGEYLGRVALQLRLPLPPPFAAFQGGADRVTADAEFFAPLSATESEVVVVPFSGITKPFILLRVFRRLASIRLGLLDCKRSQGWSLNQILICFIFYNLSEKMFALRFSVKCLDRLTGLFCAF